MDDPQHFPLSPKNDGELQAKFEKGEVTPLSQMVQPFAHKATPGAPKKGRDESARRLRPKAKVLGIALKEIITLTVTEVEAAGLKVEMAEAMVKDAMKEKTKAKDMDADASGLAMQAAAEAMEAIEEMQRLSTNEACKKAEAATKRSNEAKAEAESAAKLFEEASGKLERAKEARNDAVAKAESAKAVLASMNWKSEDWPIQHDIHEDEVKFRYSDYVSYCKDKNPGYPIRAWTLSEEQLDCFRTRYIISRDLSAEQVRKKIDDLLEQGARQIRECGDFWFDIPKRDLKYLDYSGCLALPLVRRGHTSKRSFSNGNTKHQACITAWLLNYLYDTVEEGSEVTERLVYYERKLLFRNAKAVANALTDICHLLECTERSLCILPQLKGEVRGKLLLKTNDEEADVDCRKRDTKIPRDIRTIYQIEKDASTEFVLVVEKETMYRYLINAKFHENYNCILVCGMGMPDERTRGFVRMLDEKLDIPIYGITDPDPYGISIMRTYAKGSVNLALCNVSYATNSIHWLGISTMDIQKIEHENLDLLLERCTELSPKEIKMLQNMKTSKYELSTLWTARIDDMLYFSKKACFEDLNVLGKGFASNFHIPYLINRVKKSMEEARGKDSSGTDPLTAQVFTYDIMNKMTRDFGRDALVYDRPDGSLYAAVLESGKKVAVKRLNTLQHNEFVAHANAASKLSHPNCAVLIGCCTERGERLLVYEFSTTLHDALRGDKYPSWKQRVKIAIDIAKGVEYLHGKGLVHGDINSQNVLLLDNNEAKILDFEVPNLKESSNGSGQHLHLASNYGTQLGDVCNFGVLLLELLTGRDPAESVETGGEKVAFAIWGWRMIENGMLNSAVDTKLSGLFDATQVCMMGELASSCLTCLMERDIEEIREVVQKLSIIVDTDDP